MMKKHFYFTGILLVIIGITLMTSCRKKQDTIAKIIVKDTADVLVYNARVILHGSSTTDPKKPVVRRDTAYTNHDGVALFNYDEVYQLGQAGVAVLDIEAKKGKLYGEGIIKVVEEEETIGTVYIQP